MNKGHALSKVAYSRSLWFSAYSLSKCLLKTQIRVQLAGPFRRSEVMMIAIGAGLD